MLSVLSIIIFLCKVKDAVGEQGGAALSHQASVLTVSLVFPLYFGRG